LWEQLKRTKAALESDHADSPTTTRVIEILEESTPPSVPRVESLLEEAADPKPPRPDGDTWGQLEDISDRLNRDLPNADLTAEVSDMITAGSEEYAESTVEETLSEAKTLLERWETLESQLDELPAGTTVRIEK